MSKRTPALSTQLKAVQAEIEKLKEKLTREEANSKSYREQRDEMKNEVEQIHSLLDVIGTTPRKTDHENSWERVDIKAMTRLTAYLAGKKQA